MRKLLVLLVVLWSLYSFGQACGSLPLTAPGTPNYGLCLIPDHTTEWGQTYRNASPEFTGTITLPDGTTIGPSGPSAITTGSLTDTGPMSNHTANGSNSFSGTNTYSADVYFKPGRRWIDIRAYGALGNGQEISNAVTNGTTAITSSSAPFAGGDVGKSVICFGCNGTGGPLLTTISSFNSSSSVVLNSAATMSIPIALAGGGCSSVPTGYITVASSGVPNSKGVVTRNGTSGCTTAPTCVIATLPNQPGLGASCTAAVSSGVVSGISVSGGTGYLALFYWATDDTTALQNAASALTNGMAWYCPAGNYLVSSPISFNSLTDVKVFGQNCTLQTLANNHFIQANSVTDFEMWGLHLMGTYSGADTPVDQTGFVSNPGGTRVDVHDVLFDTVTSGIFIGGGGRDFNFHNNRFLNLNAPIAKGTGNTITNVKIQNNDILSSSTLSSDDAIAISGDTNTLIITGNTINGNSNGTVLRAHGIFVDPSAGTGAVNVTICDNIIVGETTSGSNPRAGIELDDHSGAYVVENAEVAHNVLVNDYEGIVLNLGNNNSDARVDSNKIRSTTSHGINGNTGGSSAIETFTNNDVISAGGTGIYQANCKNTVFAGNQVTGSAAHGIQPDSCADVVIVGNRTWSNAESGIAPTNTPHAEIIGNHSINNGKYGIYLESTDINPFVIGNRLYGNISGASSGLSSTPTDLRGTATFSSSTTVAVSFAETEPSANYYVTLGCNNDKTFWVASKATTGFTINASSTSSDSCDWMVSW